MDRRINKAAKVVSAFYKTYLYKTIIRDVSKFVAKNAKNIDWDVDKEAWMHRAGLAPYRPGRDIMSNISLLVLGGLAGAVLGLTFAPTKGTEFREQLKGKASEFVNKARSDMEQQARA